MSSPSANPHEEVKMEVKVEEPAAVEGERNAAAPATLPTPPQPTNASLSKADLEVINGIVRQLTEHESPEYII